ncbi:nuclear transport factor 2 family protein [Ulvibacterium marinum]|uniref:nuclear transport factor 2 family protein n=1 Tax=Ulvibacterium marinum TaxID=2419782 RepID=UPI002495022F|nr:nuclear transport factor 2 family protein [Ulvibacterium marinum]
MKKPIFYTVVLALIFVASCSNQLNSINKDEVVKAVDALNEALVHPEKEKLKKITSENLTYGHSSGILENQSEFIDALVNGPFDFLSIATSQDQITIYDNTAIARHIMTAKGANNGEPVDVNIGIMLVFQKRDGQLFLLARQAYKL